MYRRSRLAELRSQLERMDVLLIARDGQSADARDRVALNRQMTATRRHLDALLDQGPLLPGDLRM